MAEKTKARTAPPPTTGDIKTLLELVGRYCRQTPPAQVAAPEGEALPSITAGDIAGWFRRGRYFKLREHAIGGMARIYHAIDLHLCREVAYKTTAPDSTPLTQARFLYEAQVTARLQHPNIIPVYDCGQDPENGQPFFSMKMVRGRSALDMIVGLRRRNATVRRACGSLTERLNIFLKAADAVAYAHHLGILHRDLKPANILIGDHGEVYVIDWGIAQIRAGKEHLCFPECPGSNESEKCLAAFLRRFHHDNATPEHLFLGSPVHMAPEQFTQETRVDERADIYGLGCTLYEMIGLHPPFDPHLPLDQMLALKRRAKFPPLWKLVPAIRYDLAEIVHRCLDPRRSRRFRSVHQLQDAIKDFIRNLGPSP